MAARMRAALPTGWFPDVSPVLDAVLAGFGSVWAAVFGLYVYLVAQLRIATATGGTLDMIAWDFFAARLYRRPGEADPALRARIGREMFRERATRHAVVQVLTDLVGKAPVVFEPAYTYDTGGYAAAGSLVGTGLAYNRAGGYGSMMLPFQFFVVAFRGSISPIAGVMGYWYGSGWAGGGYGAGAIEYVNPSQFDGQITDAAMQAAVASVLPAATIAWMAIVDSSPWTVPPNPVTGLAAG